MSAMQPLCVWCGQPEDAHGPPVEYRQVHGTHMVRPCLTEGHRNRVYTPRGALTGTWFKAPGDVTMLWSEVQALTAKVTALEAERAAMWDVVEQLRYYDVTGRNCPSWVRRAHEMACRLGPRPTGS